MIVQEVVVGSRQGAWLQDPGIAKLTSPKAHERYITMLPAGWRKESAHEGRGLLLVATAHKQHNATQQHVDGKAVMRPRPARQQEVSPSPQLPSITAGADLGSSGLPRQ